MARTKQVEKMSDSEAEERINKIMVDSGERDRLRAKLREQLDEANWRESVKMEAKEIIAEKGPNMSLEDLIQEMTPKAAALVPDDIRRELVKDVQKVIEKHDR